MSSGITIRPSQPDDYASVYTILKTTWFATYKDYIPEFDLQHYLDTEYTEEKYGLILTDAGSHALLVLVEGKPAGWMRLRFMEDCLNVVSLYILPEYQGMGLGTLLLEKAREIAQGREYMFLSLGVMKNNIRSKLWYEKQGFHFTAEEPFQLGSTKIMHLIGTKQVGA